MGIDISNSGGSITISGEDASTSNKGIAKFDNANFAVSSGVVSVKDNGINFFRLSSDLIPWASEYKLDELPDHWEIVATLGECGKFAEENNIRITSHPGPFNVLTSPHEHVVENCVGDLTIHGDVFDMLGQSRTHYNKVNIHSGGAYGD